MSDSPYNYFSLSEFACPCCKDSSRVDRNFVAKLDRARGEAKVPFKITSGYRCAKHNSKVGGVKGSAHSRGCAADISVTDSQTRYKALSALLKHFNRVGVAKTFIHVDDDPTKPQGVTWLYD